MANVITFALQKLPVITHISIQHIGVYLEEGQPSLRVTWLSETKSIQPFDVFTSLAYEAEFVTHIFNQQRTKSV